MFDVLASMTSAAGTTVNYAYDLADNILSISVNGNTTSYTYDQLNRLTKVVNGVSAAEYFYDNAGRRTLTKTSHNLGTISTTSYTYNYAGSITSLYNYDWSGELISQFTYTYDTNGNVLTEYDSAANKTTTYTYDILGRLVSEIGGGSSRYYTYDVAGNRQKAIVDTTITIRYNYDNDGRLISENRSNGQMGTSITYSYDANGNLISKSIGVKKTTYAFDVWGNMISGAKGTYTYNAQGLRTSKTVNGETIDFTLVGGNVWSDGTYNYVWGAELITNGSVYYVYNAHGDVIQLLDADGNLIKTYDYDAYGNELTRDQNDSNPFRYCGEYYDTETGFIYLRARYYDPNTGRFISQDPAHDGLNWYAYCGDNPVNYFDTMGLSFGTEALTFLYLLHTVLKCDIGVGAYRGLINYWANKQLQDLLATTNDYLRSTVNNDYIDDQDQTWFKTKYNYGRYPVSHNGCEPIAVYNALRHLGKPEKFEDVLYEFTTHMTMIGSGYLGTNPCMIGEILDYYGIEHISPRWDYMTEPGLYIVSYWNSEKVSDRVHTVAVVYDGEKYMAHNYAYDEDKNGYNEFHPEDYSDRYIQIYYLYIS